MSLRPAVLLGGALLLAASGPAPAHSLLLAAMPAVGAVLSAPPARVALSFNNRIEKALSRLTLVDSRGGRRALRPATDGAPDQLAAGLPALAPDTYRLEWQVLSTDGHVVSGSYSFRVVLP